MNRVTFSVVAIMLLAAATTLPFVLNAGFGKAPQGAQLSQVEASPHYRDGQFHNQLPTPGFTGQKNMLAAWWDFLMTKRENARPAQPLPLVKTDLATLPLGQDVMVWLGHSSWYLQLAGKRILIDPVFSDYAAPFSFINKAFPGDYPWRAEGMPEIDLLIISHDHYDHLDYATIRALLPKIKRVITPLGVGSHLRYWGMDGALITEADWQQAVPASDELTVHAQPRAALALAQAELKSAEASLRQSQQLLTRYERLINNHSISRNDVDTARMQRDVAAAAVQQAKARVEAQQIVLSYTQIAAPVTGRVGHSAFHVGTLVNSSSGVLVDIVQLDPVRVSFALDEAAFFSKTGQHADIHALKQAWLAQIEIDGKRRDGVLTSIDNRIDARTGSVAVRAEFANPQHRLLPGGSVTILFRPQELPSRVMVPAAAVQQDPQGFFSWVLKPDHTAGQRRLTLAGQQGQQFAVEKGLQAGEQVITDGAQRLREGAAVQVLN